MSLLPFGSPPTNQATFTTSGKVKQTVYNVRDYGATGNGSTDDTTAIQAAVTAAYAAGGGIIFFPTGTYIVSSSISVGGGFPGAITIEGVGWDSQIKLANASNTYIFDFGSAGSPQYTPGLTIRDLYLNCNGANQTTAGGGIYARGAVHCVFSHLYIDTPWGEGIRFYQDGTGTYGHHNTITDGSWFVNGKNSNGGGGQGIKFEAADENRVIGCTFQDNGKRTGSFNDAQIYDTNAGLQTIMGCAFVNGGTDIPFIKSDSNPARLMISGNAFDSPVGNANAIDISGTDNVIVGNTFLGIGNGASGNCAGIHIGGSYNAITGNNFFSSGAHAIGILEDGGGDFNEFGANTFDGTFVTKLSYSGAHDQVFDDGSGNTQIYGKLKAPSIQITTSPTNGYVLTSDASGNGTWQVGTGGSGITRSINNVSSTTSAGATAATDYVYLCTSTFTITLPTAVSNTNRYTIKNAGSGTITVATTSTQTIDGTTTISIPVNNSVDLVSNNSNWDII